MTEKVSGSVIKAYGDYIVVKRRALEEKVGTLYVPKSENDIYEVVDGNGKFEAGNIVLLGRFVRPISVDNVDYFFPDIKDVVATL